MKKVGKFALNGIGYLESCVAGGGLASFVIGGTVGVATSIVADPVLGLAVGTGVAENVFGPGCVAGVIAHSQGMDFPGVPKKF